MAPKHSEEVLAIVKAQLLEMPLARPFPKAANVRINLQGMV